VILATTTVKAMEFMETVEFCGTVCHTVMEPEYVAFQRSPHASIHCVDCHIGTGAGGFIEAKMNGAWQMVSAIFDFHERPVPTPVHNLPDTAETCLHCHWPKKHHGVIPKVITRFDEDEANTETKTILLMNVGGHDFQSYHGIHWHADPEVEVRYRSDPKRETVYEVELVRRDGSTKRYVNEGLQEDGETEWRTMDCTDCHNRPAHVFYGADEAVDLALDREFITPDLPYLKREAIQAIQVDYATQEEAQAAIPDAITEFYRNAYPVVASEREADVDEAGRVLAGLYTSNVFPTMELAWGTYPNHLGHQRTPGCFRCHAGNLVADDGQAITVDCRICHTIVAWDEASPEILDLIASRRGPRWETIEREPAPTDDAPSQ
jgi:hypothetical protein